MEEFWKETTIMKYVVGSHAYGFATEESDYDVRAVCRVPARYVIGLHGFEQAEPKVPESIQYMSQERTTTDVVYYGLQKFVKLAADCNPNIIELLYMPLRHCLFLNLSGEQLLSARDMFLSKKAKHTFSGYAI